MRYRLAVERNRAGYLAGARTAAERKQQNHTQEGDLGSSTHRALPERGFARSH